MKQYKIRHQVTINGQTRRFVGDTEKEIRRKIAEWQATVERSKRFSAVADEWIALKTPQLSPNTVHGYVAGAGHAQKYFGNIEISKIQPQKVDSFVKDLYLQGFAYKTVKNAFMCLKLILDFSVIKGYTENNPCLYVKVPSGPRTERQPLTEDEVRIVTERRDEFPLPYFLLLTGLRLGEALAATYEDIDGSVLKITKSLYWADSQLGKLKEPKTRTSQRSVVLPAVLLDVLPGKSGLIFPDPRGGLMREREYYKIWRDFQQKTGISATAHQFRHTYATILYDVGIDVKTAQKLLGHAQTSTTLGTYTHIRERKELAGAAALDAFFSSSAQKYAP